MTAADYIWMGLLFSGICALIYGRIRLGKIKRLFITDYQRGVRYRNGVFVEVLEPCSRSFHTPGEQIEIVDMRPVQFVIERLMYKDVLQNPSVVSIGAELKVSDPQLACTSLKNQIHDSVAIVRNALRAVVSKSFIEAATESRSKTAKEIEFVANAALNKVGMQVTNLEITEAWTHVVQPRMIVGTN
jgi:hypothetical protein